MNRNLLTRAIPFLLAMIFLFSFSTGGDMAVDNAATPGSNISGEMNRNVFKKFQKVTGDVDVIIIESQSQNPAYVMDSIWFSVADSLSLSSNIYSQTKLDSLDLVSAQSVLIYSSGVADLSVTRRDAILNFIRRGGNVYLQAEYTTTFSTNQAFVALVDSLGGSFQFQGTVSGQLRPMIVGGGLDSNYNVVDTLNYFWYGCAGSGDSTVVPFLTYSDRSLGFVFTPPDDRYGKIICTTDQDWIRVSSSKELMENILYALYSRATVISESTPGALPAALELYPNYPNPFNPQTVISYTLKNESRVTLEVYDLAGRRIQTLVDERQTAGRHSVTFNARELASGVYIYRLVQVSPAAKGGTHILSGRMVLLK